MVIDSNEIISGSAITVLVTGVIGVIMFLARQSIISVFTGKSVINHQQISDNLLERLKLEIVRLEVIIEEAKQEHAKEIKELRTKIKSLEDNLLDFELQETQDLIELTELSVLYEIHKAKLNETIPIENSRMLDLITSLKHRKQSFKVKASRNHG